MTPQRDDQAEDVRVAHTDPATLSTADLARREEIVALLRTPAHELDPVDRRRTALVRASFTNVGDYVALLGNRRGYAWIMGKIQRVEGRFLLVEAGGDRRAFQVKDRALAALWNAKSEYWLGRITTDAADLPKGFVEVLEPLG